MKSRALIAALSAALLLTAGSAFAQASLTWVSGVGDDANPCSRTAPCRTFAGAISKTAAGGEINALDPGSFGAVTITKSITIDGGGMLAGVRAPGTNGIVVNAGATDVVVLRRLSFHGLGTGLSGVNFIAGGALHVEDSTIRGFTTAAINFKPAAGSLFLRRVTATGNTNGLVVGGSGRAVISKSSFLDDGTGLYATDAATVSVHDSVFTGNANFGLRCDATAVLNVERGLIAGNGVGVQGDSLVRLSDVMVGHNTTGLAGANVASFGNNRIAAGNATNGAPANTLPQQ